MKRKAAVVVPQKAKAAVGGEGGEGVGPSGRGDVVQEEHAAGEEAEQQAKKPKVSASVRNKRKKRKAKGLHKQPKLESKNRDFSSDLEGYLGSWERRIEEGSSWKFNKVLQAWAIAHCTNEKRIDDQLFGKLVPYLESVQGGARDRLKETLRKVIMAPADPARGKAKGNGREGEREKGGRDEGAAVDDDKKDAVEEEEEEEEDGEEEEEEEEEIDEAERLRRRLKRLGRAEKILSLLHEQ